jgi:hypothetical protein
MRHSRSLPQSLQFICDCGESIAARSTSVWRRNFHQDKGESGSFEILKHASEDPTLPRAKRKCATCQCSVEHVYFQQVRRSERRASLPDARCAYAGGHEQHDGDGAGVRVHALQDHRQAGRKVARACFAPSLSRMRRSHTSGSALHRQQIRYNAPLRTCTFYHFYI